MSEKRKYKMVLGEDGKRHRVYEVEEEETPTIEEVLGGKEISVEQYAKMYIENYQESLIPKKEETFTCEQGTQEEMDEQRESIKEMPLPPYMARGEKLTQAIKQHKATKVILIIVSVLGCLLLGVILSYLLGLFVVGV